MHELLGLNDYLTAVADRLAELGYVVLAPDIFWRIDPDAPLGHTEEAINQGFGRLATFDPELGWRTRWRPSTTCEASRR